VEKYEEYLDTQNTEKKLRNNKIPRKSSSLDNID